MPKYSFDPGNSAKGSIGLFARIQSDGPEEAVCRLNEILEGPIEVAIPDKVEGEYITLYIGNNNIGTKDIEDVEEDN